VVHAEFEGLLFTQDNTDFIVGLGLEETRITLKTTDKSETTKKRKGKRDWTDLSALLP
jgi:hypothetical protein